MSFSTYRVYKAEDRPVTEAQTHHDPVPSHCPSYMECPLAATNPAPAQPGMDLLGLATGTEINIVSSTLTYCFGKRRENHYYINCDISSMILALLVTTIDTTLLRQHVFSMYSNVEFVFLMMVMLRVTTICCNMKSISYYITIIVLLHLNNPPSSC